MEINFNNVRDVVYVILVVLNLATQAILMLGDWR
jgi:hypothetical protein